MLLSFDRGSQSEPKGHALAYVRSATDPNEVYATYLIVPPIAIDLAKYMPPMFAGTISMADVESLAAIPLPPVPEKVESLAYVMRIAETRDDDVLALGTVNVTDIQSMLAQVTEAAQDYLRAYTAHVDTLAMSATPLPSPPPELAPSMGADVDEVLISLMSDRDRLSELAKLVGKLRYVTEGGDLGLVDETVAEMEALGRHLPEKYLVPDIVSAARQTGAGGSKLSELRLARCYKMLDEDYRAVEALDGSIRELEAGRTAEGEV